MPQNLKYAASALHGVPVYATAFALTHCAYPQMDGKVELTCVEDYILRWFALTKKITHPSTTILTLAR